MEDFSILFTSLMDNSAAEDVAEAIVLRKLAASAYIVPEMKVVRASRSQKVKSKTAALMIIKTQTSKVDQLIEYMKHNTADGDYLDITSTRMEQANIQHLNWIKNSTTERTSVTESLI